MINLQTQIQSLLDAIGVHLDGESFENLISALRVRKLSWMLNMALAVALSFGVKWLKERAAAEEKARQDALDSALAQ